MDDLSGLKWSSGPESSNKDQTYKGLPSKFTPLQPSTHASGPIRPATKPPADYAPRKNAPGDDGFSNLVSFPSSSSTKNRSLQEQQKILQEQQAKHRVTQNQQLDALYSAGDEQFWNELGNGSSTPAAGGSQSTDPLISGHSTLIGSNGSTRQNESRLQRGKIDDDDDDILSAFKADNPVDSSSHFPKPSVATFIRSDSDQRSPSSVSLSLGGLRSPAPPTQTALDRDGPLGFVGALDHDSRHSPCVSQDTNNDDDDVLGPLGKPASELTKPQPLGSPSLTLTENSAAHLQDQALAELIEMGFLAEMAKEALENSDSGTNVQQAVTWLLNKAHSEARQKSGRRQADQHRSTRARNTMAEGDDGARPVVGQPETRDRAYLNGLSRERRSQSSDPSNQFRKDPAQMASEMGTNFIRSAGTFWKSSSRKVQQAVQDLNSDSDSSQPKWMKNPGATGDGRTSSHEAVNRAPMRSGRPALVERSLQPVTDEAILLESSRPEIAPARSGRWDEVSVDPDTKISRKGPTIVPLWREAENLACPPFFHQRKTDLPGKPNLGTRLNPQAIEEQASQAYVSSSRRRKLTPKPTVPAPEPDLLEGASQIEVPLQSVTRRPAPLSQQSSPASLVSTRPRFMSRSSPSVSADSLRASHANREAGNSYYKRGDYSAAQESYAASLSHLPTDHPIAIILYTNRALTSLKIGDPKGAISDSEQALRAIGPSRGENETIDVVHGEPPKPMPDYFGKALMRKAEALEQVEKWEEAAAVWKEAVEIGYGGTTSIQGRLRCERAAKPQRPNQAIPRSAKTSATAGYTRSAARKSDESANRRPPAAAVNKLRAANASADKIDDEKFALADTVDARLAGWKNGKADNVRALLGSLDAILWPGAGWKKIGMAELVLPSKVKVHYMKGIGKVHPDKLPPTATTEQRMIAGAVFSTLNEAWDKFKAENGL